MEIMGLAIVIVLVVLGFLFVVRLRQFEGTSIREEFTETALAANIAARPVRPHRQSVWSCGPRI